MPMGGVGWVQNAVRVKDGGRQNRIVKRSAGPAPGGAGPAWESMAFPSAYRYIAFTLLQVWASVAEGSPPSRSAKLRGYTW